MPLSTLEAGVPRPSSTRGIDPDADDGEVALDARRRFGAHRAHRAVALERRDAVSEHELDAVARVDVAVERADLGAEDPLVGQRQRVDHA